LIGGGGTEADAGIRATPVRSILELLAERGPLLPDGCLGMDLGSTKTQIMTRRAARPEGVQPLGGHPMCGKETAGIAAADAALYQGSPLS
jgi:prephenate dehydrogenase